MARNPNGKRGSQRHRDVQEAELEKAKTEFPDDRVDTEVTISTPNGKKKSRVADVAAFSKDKPLRFFKVTQVGLVGKDGKPVKREQEAIEDIEAHIDIEVTFVDYKKDKSEKDGKTN